LAHLIGEATEALSHLDAEALEEIGRRAGTLAHGGAGTSSGAMVPVLEHRFRLFAALLRATGDNLATLRRAKSRQSYGAESFGRQSFGANEALPLNGYGSPRALPARGLFESFGLYSEAEADASIWPRGRMAQDRACLDATLLKPTHENLRGRA
jgi:hypothetical protein